MADDLGMRDLEARLRDLASVVEHPVPEPSLPARVVAQIADGQVRERRRLAVPGGWGGRSTPPRLRPARRALLIAVALLLLVAAVAAAVALGLPRVRIVLVPPGSGLAASAIPTTSAGLPGGLGSAVDAETVPGIVGFDPWLPAGTREPDAWFVAGERLSVVWRAGADLPPIEGSSAGLVLTELRGDVDRGWYEKLVDAGAAVVAPVGVGGETGFWIEGEPHALVYRDPTGAYVEETRRTVGDVLVWEAGGLTFRLESALGRDASIALAETLRPGEGG